MSEEKLENVPSSPLKESGGSFKYLLKGSDAGGSNNTTGTTAVSAQEHHAKKEVSSNQTEDASSITAAIGTRQDFEEAAAATSTAARDALLQAERLKRNLWITMTVMTGSVVATFPLTYWLSASQYRVPRLRAPAKVALFRKIIVGLTTSATVTAVACGSPIGWYTWREDSLEASRVFDECYFTAKVALRQFEDPGKVEKKKMEKEIAGGEEVVLRDDKMWQRCAAMMKEGKNLATAPLFR